MNADLWSYAITAGIVGGVAYMIGYIRGEIHAHRQTRHNVDELRKWDGA